MQTFIPDGFVLLPAAVDRVALKKNVPREEAEQMLRQSLFRREIDYVFQAEETGVHFTMELRPWASANAANWFDDGRVFLHKGQYERVPFGPFIPGAPNDVNFADRLSGEWAIILIVEASLSRYLSAQNPSGLGVDINLAARDARPSAPKGPGRKKGQGSYEKLDEPLLIEMQQLLVNGKAASPEEAARLVADHAHGSGSKDSKMERLAKRYRKRQ